MTARTFVTTAVLAGAFCAAGVVPAVAQNPGQDQSFQPFRTVWDGVYTKAEADRGKETAARLCAGCHGTDLKGGAAPKLTGSAFFDRWVNLRLKDVVSYIQAAMPHEQQFYVSADQTRDVIAFMLRESHVPAGHDPISPDVNVLSDILITRPAER